MTRDELILQVALRMDEITPSSGLDIPVDGADNNPLYELIDGLIDDCALELFSVAPYWRLPQTQSDERDITLSPVFAGTAYERKVIRIKLADDFLRVAEINHPDFQRPITEVVPEQSPEGRHQHNRHLFAKSAKPVGVISHGIWDGVPCREIDCYSVSKDTDGLTGIDASYIAKPEIINGYVEGIVPSVLIPALEWLTAARAFGSRGDTNHAAICQQNAQNIIM